MTRRLHIAALPSEAEVLRGISDDLLVAEPGDSPAACASVTLSLVPQAVQLQDLAVQRVRRGLPVTRAILAGLATGPAFDRLQLVRRWPGAAIRARREAALPADLIAPLATPALPAPPGWRQAALINVIARHVPHAPPMPEMPGAEPLLIDRAFAQDIQRGFAASNAELAASLDLSAERLEPDWSLWPEAGTLHLLDRPCPFEAELGALIRAMQA